MYNDKPVSFKGLIEYDNLIKEYIKNKIDDVTVGEIEIPDNSISSIKLKTDTDSDKIKLINLSNEVIKYIQNNNVVNSTYMAEKTDFNKADNDIIIEYFIKNPDIVIKNGDTFVITTIIENKIYEKSSYTYDDGWIAITGNVDADKVIFREDILLSGEYDKFGNLSKDKNGVLDFKITGMSVSDVFKSILSKRVQPEIISEPYVYGFSLSGAKNVEAGTFINEMNFGTANLNPGEYSYNPTNVKMTNSTIDRICIPDKLSYNSIINSTYGTDNNNNNGFIIGDLNDFDNVVNSIYYRVNIEHTEGDIALDNYSEQSDPIIKILSGTKSQNTKSYTCYRNYFFGCSTDNSSEINSDFIRSLNKSNKEYTSEIIKLIVPKGTLRICIACLSSKKGVVEIINETALNTNITSVFNKILVDVEGANGYTALPYNVWVYEPAIPFSNSATLKITLGG